MAESMVLIARVDCRECRRRRHCTGDDDERVLNCIRSGIQHGGRLELAEAIDEGIYELRLERRRASKTA